MLRKALFRHPLPNLISNALVIGAGISGASVAYALATRGWQVTVVDTHQQPATQASSLPAGLAVPVVSADDNAASQISRAGITLLTQMLVRLTHAGLLTEGLDWAPSGVKHWRGTDEQPYSNIQHCGGPDWLQAHADAPALWHPKGLWLTPHALVKAWLTHPNIHFKGGVLVKTIAADSTKPLPNWRLVGLEDKPWAMAPVVIVANAIAAKALLCASDLPLKPSVKLALAAMHIGYGTVTMGRTPDSVFANPQDFPPCNGRGSLIPAVPINGTHRWVVGANFDSGPRTDIDTLHAENLVRLHRLAPAWSALLDPSEELQAWQGQRCISHDRMPLVGSLLEQPNAGLWINAAMGSRGLSMSVLCAEIIARQISGESMPIAAVLLKQFLASRYKKSI